MKAVASPAYSAAQEDIAYYFRIRHSERSASAGAQTHDSGVLVIDDQRDSIEPVVKMLRKTGCEADCVESAAAALASLAAKRPKLVLLDIAMPEMDGIELLKELRRRAETRDLRVIMLTADPLRAPEAMALGALDYILKPVDLPLLRRRLSKYL
jgi:CheY-like chemotaxis protein